MEQDPTPRRIDFQRQLLKDQDGRCAYCGCVLFLSGDTPRHQRPKTSRPATWDHVIPRCLGGRRSRENLVLACEPCNSAKGGLLPLAFIALRG